MTLIRKIALCFLSVLCCSTIIAQDEKRIDSVKKILKDPSLTEQKKAWALAQLGWDVSYYNLNEGLKYAEEGIRIAQKNNFTKELGHAYNVAGTIHMDLGNYPVAMDYLTKAGNYYTSINDKKGIAIASGNLGIIYTRRGEYKEALKHFFTDYAYFEGKPGNGLNSVLLNIGSSYHQVGLLDSSLYFLNLAAAQPVQDSLQRSSVYNNIASTLMDKGELKISKEYILRAINCVDTTKKYYLAEHYMILGIIESKFKNFPAAIAAANIALKYSKEVGVKEFEKNCYSSMSEIYEAQGNLARALENYKLYKAVQDSLINIENERAIRYMEGKLEMDKKEKEIELLNIDKKLQEEKIQHDRNLINTFISGGIILLIALCLAVYAFANKRKANKKLHVLNSEIHQQKNELQEKNTAITDSIHYARRIQNALLTSEHYIKKYVPDFFILNMPKDIVSGDFYWAYSQNGKMYFMCADCTGHGVPGAFMSLLGINFLNELVIERKITSPEQVLDHLRSDIIQSLNKQGNEETQDGMDCIFCEINLQSLELQMASANNTVWVVRPPLSPMQTDDKGVLKLAPGFKFTEVSPDKMPVGKSPKDSVPFTLKKYLLKKGDCIYMFSDGFVDQFGGPKGKKLKYKLLKEAILKNCHLPMNEQKTVLKNLFAAWKGDLEQVDDVLVVGIKV